MPTKTKNTNHRNGERLNEGEVALVIWNVPKTLREEFKAKCVRNQTSMRAEVIKFMKAFKLSVPTG